MFFYIIVFSWAITQLQGHLVHDKNYHNRLMTHFVSLSSYNDKVSKDTASQPADLKYNICKKYIPISDNSSFHSWNAAGIDTFNTIGPRLASFLDDKAAVRAFWGWSDFVRNHKGENK